MRVLFVTANMSSLMGFSSAFEAFRSLIVIARERCQFEPKRASRTLHEPPKRSNDASELRWTTSRVLRDATIRSHARGHGALGRLPAAVCGGCALG